MKSHTKMMFLCLILGGVIFGPVGSVWADAPPPVTCITQTDTFILHGHGPSYGYPDAAVVKSYSWVGSDALFRFDLTDIESIQAAEHRIVSAVFNTYTGQCTGVMCHPMAPEGTTQQAQVLALRTWDPQVHPHGLTYWTEAPRGAYADGYIDGTVESQSGLPNIYDPGDVGGVDPYYYQANGLNPGDPQAVMIHNGGPGVPVNWGGDPADLNPNGWAKVELKEFARRWVLPEERDDHIANNGIRIHDLGGWSGSPDPEYPDDYEWGWCFCSKDYITGTPGMYDPNFHLLPAGDYLPHLEVIIAANGDTDADGDVDMDDFNAMSVNWTGNSPGSGRIWPEGDFDGDGDVDMNDFNALSVNWTGSGSGEQCPGTVPEPMTLIFLGAGGLVVLRRRIARTVQVRNSQEELR